MKFVRRESSMEHICLLGTASPFCLRTSYCLTIDINDLLPYILA